MGLVKENFFYCNVSVSRCTRIVPHIINYCDLTFVLKGKLTYVVDGTEYTLRENDAMLLRPNTLRQRLAGDSPVKYVSFNFRLNEDIRLDTFMKGIINNEIRTLISAFPQSHISGLFHSKEKTESMLSYILYELIDASHYDSRNPHIVKILKYIEDNLSQTLSLGDISRHINLTKEYTACLFKKEIGKTVNGYINERKMIAAKNMIDNGEVALTDIALGLGFTNYSYFSKTFKKYYGTSPVKRKNK